MFENSKKRKYRSIFYLFFLALSLKEAQFFLKNRWKTIFSSKCSRKKNVLFTEEGHGKKPLRFSSEDQGKRRFSSNVCGKNPAKFANEWRLRSQKLVAKSKNVVVAWWLATVSGLTGIQGSYPKPRISSPTDGYIHEFC